VPLWACGEIALPNCIRAIQSRRRRIETALVVMLVPISAALPMRKLPTERAIVSRNEMAAYRVGCWLSRHRNLTRDQRKGGHAFQPGMA
jgi:hypothetical protein